jgi:hypothetical protein
MPGVDRIQVEPAALGPLDHFRIGPVPGAEGFDGYEAFPASLQVVGQQDGEKGLSDLGV